MRSASPSRPAPRFFTLLLFGSLASLLLAGLMAAEPAQDQAAPPPETHDHGAVPPEKAGSPLTVPQASICTDVKDREAVGAATHFPTSVGRLYCLTKIMGASDPTKVTHLWFHGNTQVHKVDLPVNGPAWRTYSYKTIPPGWTGDWRVDVEDAQGVVIYSIPFTVSDTPETAH